MTQKEIFEKQSTERKRYTLSIIESGEKNKLIIAGPGTGKTFTFKTLFESRDGKKLALTFINTLANDLQKELGDIAESHTFHGYCKKLLHKIPPNGIEQDFHYFPKLPLLIKKDNEYLEMTFEKFEEAFQTLSENSSLDFYIARANYYNSVSHNDAVYRVLKFFQESPSSLPVYSQIVVDEYQDFNALEIAFIEEIIKKSPVLIAGDDDQAIYDFKHASPEGIRQKKAQDDFEFFELPYCSRCTNVIVDAVSDVTSKAISLGKLQNRVEKKYLCFLPDKLKESEDNPKIIHAKCSVNRISCPYIGKFIENEIQQIPQDEIEHANAKKYPSVLIIGPSHYTKQVVDYLSDKFTNFDLPINHSKEIDIIDGYRVLIEDPSSNLGWRILAECTQYNDIKTVIQKTYEEDTSMIKLISHDFIEEHSNFLAILNKIKAKQELSDDEKTAITKITGQGIEDLDSLLQKDLEDDTEDAIDSTSLRIKVTTINGSKGLSADYVFILAMNNGDLPKNPQNITDTEICQLLVGITRARKRCYLVSNGSFGAKRGITQSVFIDWIDQSRVQTIEVSAKTLKK